MVTTPGGLCRRTNVSGSGSTSSPSSSTRSSGSHGGEAAVAPLTVTRPRADQLLGGPARGDPALARYAFRRTNSHDPGVPVYISLMKWTSQGMGGLPAWRDRIEEGERAIHERGGKLLDAYVTLGRFDVVETSRPPTTRRPTSASSPWRDMGR